MTRILAGSRGTREFEAQTTRQVKGESVTIVDVARIANVTSMTVSRYLNHHPNVSEKTARKIQAAIQKLGYSPNYAARLLMGRPSNVIGLIVPSLALPFYSDIAHAVQEFAKERGYLVWIAASNSDLATETALLKQMRQQNADGVLIVPLSQKRDRYIMPDGPPVVAIDRPVDGLNAAVVDYRKSAREAIFHLTGHGYKRIVCLGPSDQSFATTERVAGYQEAIRISGLTSVLRLECDDPQETAKIIRDSLLKKQPADALFALNSSILVQILRIAEAMKINIPGRIGVIGVDEADIAEVVNPWISTIQQPGKDMGWSAARLLFMQLTDSDKFNSSAMTTVLSAPLILRGSCGCKHQEDKPLPFLTASRTIQPPLTQRFAG